MHRLTTSWLGFGVSAAVSLSAAVSCGAPAELDPSSYPGPNETGYADDDGTGTGTAGTPLGGGGASGQGSTAGAGSPSAGTSGASSSNNPPTNNGAGAPSGAAGSAQSGTTGGGNGTPATGGGATAGGCPDDITQLFDRPLSEGGCAGAGCHVQEGTPPDLVSPNPEMRLLNVMSTCNGRPYIGADGFLADKIGGATPECGSPMPFLSADLLSDDDRQCILDWIDEVSGG